MRVLLDVHALLDMVSKAPSEGDAIEQLKVMHEFQDVELWTSVLSYVEFAAAVESAASADESKRLVEGSLSWLNVCPVETSDVIAALAVGGMTNRERVERACAERLGMDFVVSRDDCRSENAHVPCGSVADFIEYVERATNVRYAVVDLRS